jgi:hypothetical protein
MTISGFAKNGGCEKSNFCQFWLPLRPLSEGSLIIVNKVKSRKQIGKHFCSFLFMLNFGNQFPFRILFRMLSVIVVNCNLIISVKGGLVTEITFNLDSPATSNNQYFILIRFYYSSNEYFDRNLCFYVYLFIINQKYWRVNQKAITVGSSTNSGY